MVVRLGDTGDKNLGQEVQHALRAGCQFLGAQHGSLGLFDSAQASIERAYEWCSEDITAVADKQRSLLSDSLTWVLRRMQHGEATIVAWVAGLPVEATAERALWSAMGANSVMVVPLFDASALMGCLAFGSRCR